MKQILLLTLCFSLFGLINSSAQPVSDGNGASTHSAAPAASLTISTLSVPVNDDRIVVACLIGASTTGVTHDGVAMTPGPVAMHGAGFNAFMFYRTLPNGAANSGNVVAGGATLTTLVASSFYNVNPSNPVDGFTSAVSSNAGSPTITGSSLTVSSETNDLVCDCFAFFDIFNDHAVSATSGGQTPIVNNNSGALDVIGAMSHEAGAASVSMNWTTSPSTMHPGVNHGTAHAGMNLNRASILLPVELLSFVGTSKEQENHLTWKTKTEENNDYFVIERSGNKTNFKEIGKIEGLGNSSYIHQYEFTDKSPLIGANYYRLKQIDLDGVFTYSSIIEVTLNKPETVLTIFPNPTEDYILLPELEKGTPVKIFSTQGQLLLQDEVNAEQQLSLKGLPKGVYLIQSEQQDQLKMGQIVKL